MTDSYERGYDDRRRGEQERWTEPSATSQAPQGYQGQPYAGQQPQQSGGGAGGGQAESASPSGIRVDHGQFAAGVAATALVAAVAGFVITAIVNAFYTSNKIGSAWAGGPQDDWDSALIGGVGALVAGLLLWVLLNLVPSPLTFFRWITGLFVCAAVILPFLSGTDWVGRLITAIINGFLGILVISLLTAMAIKTTDAAKR